MTPWPTPETDPPKAWLVGNKAIAAAYFCGVVVLAATLLVPDAKRALGQDYGYLDDPAEQARIMRDNREAADLAGGVKIPLTLSRVLTGAYARHLASEAVRYKEHDGRWLIVEVRGAELPLRPAGAGMRLWVPGQKVEWVKVGR